MKKIFLSLVAIATVILSSCTNEEINVETVGKKYDVILNVNTQNLYDTFGVSKEITDGALRDKSYSVGVMTYIYDKNGTLCYSTSSAATNLNMQIQNLQLQCGSYTMINVETLVDSKDKKIDCWSIEGTEKMNSLKLVNKSWKMNKYDIVGTNTSEIIVNSNTEITISPKAIGSLISVIYTDFEQSSYPRVGIGTNDALDFYSLDPAKIGNDKFNYKLTTTGYFYLRASLSQDESSTLYNRIYIVENKINWEFRYQKDASSNDWYSRNSLKGSSDLEDGKEYFCGMYYENESAISCFWGNKSDYSTWVNNLKNKNKLNIKEPNTVWGASVANVHSSMSGYTQILGSSNTAILTEGTIYYATSYAGNSPEISITYLFTTSTTDLIASSVMYNSTLVGEDELLSYLNKKYTYVSLTEGIYTFITNDNKTLVTLSESNNMWMIMFMDATRISNAKSIDTTFKVPAFKSASIQRNITNSEIFSKEKSIFSKSKSNFEFLK